VKLLDKAKMYLKTLLYVAQTGGKKFRQVRLERMDQALLGAKIRNFAHILDCETKPHSQKRTYIRTRTKKLEEALGIWKRKYPLTEDIQWAQDVLLRCKNHLTKDHNKGVFSGFVNKTDDFWEIIRTRRSIRVWNERKLNADLLKKVIDAGRWAPSSCNRQACVLYRIERTELKERISLIRTGRKVHSITDASVIILVGVDQRPYLPNEAHAPAMDAAAVIENTLLAARAEGLGSCWMYWHVLDTAMEKKLRRELRIPGYIALMSLICLGYPGERPSPPGRKPVELFLADHQP
jgi:nitroreductase